MGYLLGIDLGSTSIKAVAYDFAGNLKSMHSVPTELKSLDAEHPNWSFWDPDIVWNSTVSVVQGVLAETGAGADIKGVSVTGLGMDGVPVDKTGKWLYPFISWQCTRTEPQSREFSERVGMEKIFSITGKQKLHIDTIYRLLWMKQNKPEILDQADKWLLIEDFINFMLCGRQATDYSMASCTSVFDQHKLDWSQELLDLADIDASLFPEPLPSGTVLGEVTAAAAKQTGLKPNTPVILGGHDYICAGLAAGAITPDVVLDVTGTWEIIVRALPRLILNDDIFKAGLIVESHVARDAYLLAGYSPSALMLEWFRDNYGFEEAHRQKETGRSDWDLLMEKAQQAPVGANGVMFMPHLAGAGTPVNDPRSLGAFVGLSTTTDKGCMIRALIEGLDYQFKEILASFEQAMPGTIQKVIAAGGAVRNRLWMQNKADVTGKVIEVPEMQEATTLGVALLAGIGLGIYRGEADAFKQTYRAGQIFEPDPARQAQYSEYYEIYRTAYPSLKKLNHALFEAFKS